MPAVRRNKMLQTMWKMHRGMYRMTGGRIGGKVGRFRILQLTTVGHRSALARTVLLNTIERDDGWLVIASYAGEPRHPAWWLNLLAEPTATVTFRGTDHRVRARELDGAEREEAHKRFEEIERGYAEYQERTTRRIPVVLLERTGA